MMTCRSIAYSCRPGSCARACTRKDSPGTKSTTKSGAVENCFQYALPASESTWVLQVSCVSGQAAGMHLGVVALGGVEEGRERHLGVDDDLLAAGEVDDEVRPGDAVDGGRRHLGVEVAVLEHAGDLDDSTQLHLAPGAARLRGRQSADERVGLGLQLLGRHRGQPHRLHQRGVGGDACLVGVDDRLGDLAEGLLDRLDELLHLGGLLGELAGLDLLAGLEPFVREGEERLVVVRAGPARRAPGTARTSAPARRGARPGARRRQPARPPGWPGRTPARAPRREQRRRRGCASRCGQGSARRRSRWPVPRRAAPGR